MLFVARSHYHHEGVAVNRLFVSSPTDCFLLVPLWGALPLLIYVEGAVYMIVLVGLGLLYYKWSPSLSSFVGKYSLCFSHKPAHPPWRDPAFRKLPSGPPGLVTVYPARRVTSES